MAVTSYDIAVIPGDGIGPEVVREGVRVLERVAAREGFGVRLTTYPFGAEHFLKTGEILPDAAFGEIGRAHAILLGAVGDPRVTPGQLEFGIVGRLRFELDLYVNLRPVRLYADHLCPLKDRTTADLDFVVVRENTEDAYVGAWGFFKKGTPDEVATQQMIFTRRGVERVLRHAFGLALGRRKKLTLLTKANAVRAMELWTRTFEAVGREFPDVTREHQYIDAACMYVIRDPAQYDVVVTSNMFGDIFTDLAAALQGGLGVAASGNIHPGRVSMFEPIHGSAPRFAGQGVASPVATILAVSMMLDDLGQPAAARRVEEAVARLLRSRRIPSVDVDSGISTAQAGDLVLETLEEVGATA